MRAVFAYIQYHIPAQDLTLKSTRARGLEKTFFKSMQGTNYHHGSPLFIFVLAS